MQVKCTLCDKVESLEDESFQAKRLRNSRLNLYICDDCYKRIGEKTKERHATGNFHLYKQRKKKNSLI